MSDSLDPLTSAVAATTSAASMTLSDVYLAIVRMEGKMDAAISAIRARTDDHATDLRDHENRLRVIEGFPSVQPETEQRLRALESRPYVTPKALWGAVTSGLAVLFLLLEFFAPLVRAVTP